jgi:hypothetical protein
MQEETSDNAQPPKLLRSNSKIEEFKVFLKMYESLAVLKVSNWRHFLLLYKLSPMTLLPSIFGALDIAENVVTIFTLSPQYSFGILLSTFVAVDAAVFIIGEINFLYNLPLTSLILTVIIQAVQSYVYILFSDYTFVSLIFYPVIAAIQVSYPVYEYILSKENNDQSSNKKEEKTWANTYSKTMIQFFKQFTPYFFGILTGFMSQSTIFQTYWFQTYITVYNGVLLILGEGFSNAQTVMIKFELEMKINAKDTKDGDADVVPTQDDLVTKTIFTAWNRCYTVWAVILSWVGFEHSLLLVALFSYSIHVGVPTKYDEIITIMLLISMVLSAIGQMLFVFYPYTMVNDVAIVYYRERLAMEEKMRLAAGGNENQALLPNPDEALSINVGLSDPEQKA